MVGYDGNYLSDTFKVYYNDGFWHGFFAGVVFTSTVCGVRCLIKYR